MEKFQPWMRWLAALVAAGTLLFALLTPHRNDPVITSQDAPSAQPSGAAAPAPSAESAAASVTSVPTDVSVYVCGAVRKAGVYHLIPGSRVVDAVGRAGGLSKDADPEAINLAAPLEDGMKVDVPRRGQNSDAARGSVSGLPADAVADAPQGRHHRASHRASSRSGAHKLQPGQSLNINTATESELTQLPGVGPSLARRIVEYRQANGPFQTIDDLENVSGVGPSKLAKIEPFIRL